MVKLQRQMQIANKAWICQARSIPLGTAFSTSRFDEIKRYSGELGELTDRHKRVTVMLKESERENFPTRWPSGATTSPSHQATGMPVSRGHRLPFHQDREKTYGVIVFRLCMDWILREVCGHGDPDHPCDRGRSS